VLFLGRRENYAHACNRKGNCGLSITGSRVSAHLPGAGESKKKEPHMLELDLWGFSRDYAMSLFLRRRLMAGTRLAAPVPIKSKVPGSGTVVTGVQISLPAEVWQLVD
jgi:hypothetical protein